VTTAAVARMFMNSDYRLDRAAADEVLHAYVTHLIEDEKRDSDERDRARANAERTASARGAYRHAAHRCHLGHRLVRFDTPPDLSSTRRTARGGTGWPV